VKEIYEKYKKRFIEINSKNRNIYTKSINPKLNFDIGAIIKTSCDAFENFLWRTDDDFVLIANREKLPKEYSAVKTLKKEVDEIQRETGKYDLYLGYPFIYGKTDKGTAVKAPLLLFPMVLTVDNKSVTISHISYSPITVNKSLIVALEKENEICFEYPTEFFPDDKNGYSSVNEIIELLADCGCKLKKAKSGKLTAFGDSNTGPLAVKNIAVLGRFAIDNPIYHDYTEMERKNLSSPNIELLIKGKSYKEKPKDNISAYNLYELDYAQKEAVNKSNVSKNMVIYGPPGTGKSQTIAGIIGNALCKNYRVLVVSQKQATLDVIFSRLGILNDKAMLLPDIEKDKMVFYDRLKKIHEKTAAKKTDDLKEKYRECEIEIQRQKRLLQNIREALFEKSYFGLSLREMYEKSYNIGKNSADYELFIKLKETEIITRNYDEINNAVSAITDKKLCALYLNYKKNISESPLIKHFKDDIDPHCLKECLILLENYVNNPIHPLNFDNHKYFKYLTAFYPKLKTHGFRNLEQIAKIIVKSEYKEIYFARNLSLIPVFWILLPFVAVKYNSLKKNTEIKLEAELRKLQDAEETYSALRTILDEDGYSYILENIINGNSEIIKNLISALMNFITIRDINAAVNDLPALEKEILEFCYSNSIKTEESALSVLNKIIPLRIYEEIIKCEAENDVKLKNTVCFNNIKNRIFGLQKEQRELSKEIALLRYNSEYTDYCKYDKNSKDYLYQIQKNRNIWSIKHFMNCFSEYVLRLFPCWLLSPQNVSAVFPLKPNVFDIIIFDEASQIFIENTLPAIYRAKSVVVAGDNKQLRPSATFMKRYCAEETESGDYDLPTQAALEVTSLLDLAETKFSPTYLNFHYRSEFAELIDFSNAMFYENKLRIAPNVCIDKTHPAIERIKVDGIWDNRKNEAEASAVIKLVKKILSERKNNESVGIVTFNVEQKEYIDKLLEIESERNGSFAKILYKEMHRIDSGENNSLFIKNLENVQGDERDIIIFSTGYAKNNSGKLNFQFGSLSAEGGENRLNVAITRAKKKIYLITSIEPEELTNVEKCKNTGPKLLKKYLMYARAVSCGDEAEVKSILISSMPKSGEIKSDFLDRLGTRLEKNGYCVRRNIGNSHKIPLAVFDKSTQKYILGIELDCGDGDRTDCSVEDYISRINFFENKGWKIMRIWSRDLWISPSKVTEEVISAIEKEKRRTEDAS